MINFYSIDNRQIIKVKSLNSPKKFSHLLVINDVLYTANTSSIFKYNRAEKKLKTIMTFIDVFDLNIGILKYLALPQNRELDIFDGFLAIVRLYHLEDVDADNYYSEFNVEVYDTITKKDLSFLFQIIFK
jgi:hypothetical protein